VRTVDSRTASAAIAMLGLAIQRRLERGTSDDEIEALVERFRRENGLLFTVDTLEFLAKGGRIGRAKAMAGQLLNIKPILGIADGEVVPVARVRGNQKAMREFVQRFTGATIDGPALRVGIAHAEAPERAEALQHMVHSERPHAEVEIVTTLGAVVGTHAGPGTVGFFWFTDEG
jgi:DegV family protein with EDD domain